MKLQNQSWFLSYAAERGISREVADNFCNSMEKQLNQNRIIDASRLLEIIEGYKGETDSDNVQMALHLSGWKFQGTDGVRGIVSTDRVTAMESLQLFIVKNIITPVFCKLYAKALGQMLKDHTTVSRVVLAEDGRDIYDKTGLKKGLIEGFNSLGISVEDLGIVPTPGLAAYSYKKDLPGIMLTASHNPSEYNGIKIFIDGKKLYPGGSPGEYLLSWYIFSLASEEVLVDMKSSCDAELNVSQININKAEVENNILVNLSNSINKEALSALGSCKILLDTANGAYTQTALKFFYQKGLDILPIACNPGEKSINSNCGVGVLEQLSSVLTDNDNNPFIVKELFITGRSRVNRKAFGIVLDGDGDRGFLLEYDSLIDCVRLYNGDALGFIIASGRIGNDVFPSESKLQFVCTVESDVALSIAVKDKLNINSTVSCVGDRWLITELSSDATLIAACERSGHLIVPYYIEEDKKDGTGKILYTGDGLKAVLTALSYLLSCSKKNGDLKQLIFDPGFRLQVVNKNCEMRTFYRGSKLWHEVDSIVRQVIPLEITEKLFIHEPDMLCFNLLKNEDEIIGRWYIRKSGTEQKISFTISIIQSYSEEVSIWMKALEQKISYLFRESN